MADKKQHAAKEEEEEMEDVWADEDGYSHSWGVAELSYEDGGGGGEGSQDDDATCWDEGHDLKTEDWLSASVLAAAHMHIYVYIHISPNISYNTYISIIGCVYTIYIYIYIHTHIYIPSEVPSVCAASGF